MKGSAAAAVAAASCAASAGGAAASSAAGWSGSHLRLLPLQLPLQRPQFHLCTAVAQGSQQASLASYLAEEAIPKQPYQALLLLPPLRLLLLSPPLLLKGPGNRAAVGPQLPPQGQHATERKSSCPSLQDKPLQQQQRHRKNNTQEDCLRGLTAGIAPSCSIKARSSSSNICMRFISNT